jgi:CRP/FNR family transcriptional regulator, cyclic AMP receptor protein
MESWWPVRRGGELVGYLNDDEHARFVALCEPCTAAVGDSVFQKGSPSRSLLLVEEGELEVYDESLGQAVILARVGPGGVVGEVGFLDGQPRTHFVRARAACRLRRLTRDAFVSLVESDPGLFAKLAVGLAQLLTFRFRSAVEELEPIRSFAAALREPLDLEEQNLRFDEIEMPLPEEDPDRKKTDRDTRPIENPAAEAVKVIRRVARRGRKKGGSAGV